MDGRLKSIEEIAREKAEWRHQRAKLPYPEKVRIIVEMQKRRAPIVALRGKKQIVWDLPELRKPKE